MAHKNCLKKVVFCTRCDCIKDDIEELKQLKKELKNCIKVWRFDDAPKEYQNLSKNGGDEDWIALVPKKLNKNYIGWLDSSSFGCCHIYTYKLNNGNVIYIGCHA